ncbi:hypothetical protein BZG02_01000 [Labilibaculum filiforme]|uniref:Signal transduction histidine kinase internal region domain-containing protein n=2 Tax=Labilibaculum filiforme TaxID=1940526 RepID=A0A2N3I5T6_9BACT|nr:hypothetical protein BZG02_01000 [Labilibaculum filiforme]
MASFYVLVQFFALEEEISDIDIVYTLLFHISLWIGVYLNTELLIRIFLRREKYVLYFIGLLSLWYFVAFLNQFTFEKLSDRIAPDYLFISSYSFQDLLKFSFVYIALSTLLKLSKSWFQVLETAKQLESLKREQAETELQALKSNINPHFLFNNLTSLYGLARKKSENTPEYILKLSELMRYMIYETKDRLVGLNKELDYIVNYLELQKLRCDKETKIQYKISGESYLHQIVPFLLIPFIENSFKHGGINQSHKNIVDLKVNIKEENLEMRLTNSIPLNVAITIDQIGGFGIDNVKSRLELFYKDKYTLHLFQKEEEFIVELKIKLK